MVIRHGERVAVAESLYAHAVCANHHVVDFARFPLHPIEQRGAEVEAQVFVDRNLHLLAAIFYFDGDKGLVGLTGDAHIPVVIGRGRWLRIDFAGPRILSWRLVEMSVNHHQSLRWRAHFTTSSMLRSTFGNRLSCAPSASTRCIVASSIVPLCNTRTKSSACAQCSSKRCDA